MRNVIEMALKSLFFVQKPPIGWGLRPQAPFEIRVICIGYSARGVGWAIFVQSNVLLVQASPPFSKIMAALLVALWFQKRAKYD